MANNLGSLLTIAALTAFAVSGVASQTCDCVGVGDTVPRVTCYEDYAIDGLCMPAMRKDAIMYPTDYGGHCGPHLEPAFSSCFDLETNTPLDTPDEWCGDRWCYVDGCTCELADIDGGPSSYFNNPDGQPPVVAYSYANCPDETDSTTPDFGHAPFNATVYCDQMCPCVEYPPDIPRVTCYEDYAPDNTCLVMKDLDYALYPEDYGAACKKHAEPGSASCWDLATGEELADGVREGWCDQVWCYVDGCTCNLADVTGGPTSYSHTYTGNKPVISYSYTNCAPEEVMADATDLWGHATFDRDEYCTGDDIECSLLKDYYRDHACCGMPTKMIPKPAWR